MVESSIRFENHLFQIEKEESLWSLSLKRSEVQVQSARELTLLELSDVLFLDCQLELKEDAVDFHYQLTQDLTTFDELKKRTRVEKLRSMLNTAAIKNQLNGPFSFFVDPENLLFDRNLNPKIAYRGIKGKMPPSTMSPESLLRQYKSLIIALFGDKQEFSALTEGTLEALKGNPFEEMIKEKKSFEEIEGYLVELYDEAIEQDQKTIKRVSKLSYRIFQQSTIWLGVLAILLSVPLIYALFFQAPFQTRMLEADTGFLKNDYESVINKLETVQTKKIPFEQKYILAYSFVQGKELSDKQKVSILNNITLKSDTNYLDYWIENGRGNLDEALDIGKKLEDSDLILYGIMQKIEEVRNDAN